MDRRQQYQIHKEYIEKEGLDKLIDFSENIDYAEKVFDAVSGELKIPFPPEANDLVRLHKLIRSRKCFTVLEFGIGYSTVIFADALSKNEKDWAALTEKPKIRNRYMFQLFSVDASEKWIEEVEKCLPDHLKSRIHLNFSRVEIGTHRGQLCHFYKNIPDIISDFIYLDGPSAKDVEGNINGLSFQCEERTVMSGDLLLMEPSFLPGIMILVDGRVNNARFLARNLTRNYKIIEDKENDVTTFELDEERLGKYNLSGSDFFK